MGWDVAMSPNDGGWDDMTARQLVRVVGPDTVTSHQKMQLPLEDVVYCGTYPWAVSPAVAMLPVTSSTPPAWLTFSLSLASFLQIF